jgi:hypothetical protein
MKNLLAKQARVCCSSLMPIEPFLRELRAVGLFPTMCLPSEDRERFAGHIVHVTGFWGPARELKKMLGDAKVEALKESPEVQALVQPLSELVA